MITIRCDDVLCSSRKWNPPEERYAKYCRWLDEGVDTGVFKHMPTILVSEIQAFPSVIKHIREETAKGRMFPELHGWKHIDYGALDQKTIEEHLEKSIEWMQINLNVIPKLFLTPWGARASDHPPIALASAKFNLIPVDTDDTRVPARALDIVRRLPSLQEAKEELEKRVLLTHWWEEGTRIPRLIKIFKYGGLEEAAKAEPECFS